MGPTPKVLPLIHTMSILRLNSSQLGLAIMLCLVAQAASAPPKLGDFVIAKKNPSRWKMRKFNTNWIGRIMKVHMESKTRYDVKWLHKKDGSRPLRKWLTSYKLNKKHFTVITSNAMDAELTRRRGNLKTHKEIVMEEEEEVASTDFLQGAGVQGGGRRLASTKTPWDNRHLSTGSSGSQSAAKSHELILCDQF